MVIYNSRFKINFVKLQLIYSFVIINNFKFLIMSNSVYGSSKYQTNQTNTLKVDKLISTKIIVDETFETTIENGYIKNVNNPLNNNDVVNKKYVDVFGGQNPDLPYKSVQYNKDSVFTGSENFTFD